MKRFLKCLEQIYRFPRVLLTGSGGDAHEQSFERLLKEYDLQYLRHPLGKRRTPDFSVLGRKVELKSSTSEIVFLNDSFFRDDYLYVISAVDTSIIAFGRDLYSPLELEKYEVYHRELLELRRKYADMGRLRLYPRSANRFSINSLDRDYLFDKVKNELS